MEKHSMSTFIKKWIKLGLLSLIMSSSVQTLLAACTVPLCPLSGSSWPVKSEEGNRSLTVKTSTFSVGFRILPAEATVKYVTSGVKSHSMVDQTNVEMRPLISWAETSGIWKSNGRHVFNQQPLWGRSSDMKQRVQLQHNLLFTRLFYCWHGTHRKMTIIQE